MSHSVRLGLVAVLWTLSVAFGIMGTVEMDLRLMFWSLLVALAASVATVQIMMLHAVRCERVRVEHLVDGLIARARERADADLPRVR